MSDGAEVRKLAEESSGWRDFFNFYKNIILVANSGVVDIAALKRAFGEGALFVFFNKTYKVIREPFDRPALLVARSSAAGANIVYRREVDTVLRPFDRSRFIGVLNLRVGHDEAFSAAADFEAHPVGFLDLADEFADFYPSCRIPSSGFALAVWLAEQRLAATIHLAGFSAKRSERWKLFQAHDWTFEQIAQRLLADAGRLRIVGAGNDSRSALLRLAERFPEIAADRIALTAAEVLGERLAHTDAAVDRLLSLTRWQARLDGAMRLLKPKTRKQRLAERSGGENATSGLAKGPGSE